MQGMTSLSWWIVTLIGLMSFIWATPLPLAMIVRATWSGITLGCREIGLCTLTVSQHAITEGWTFTFTEILWTPHPGYPSGTYRAFAPEWQCSITEAEDRGRSHLEQVELYYNRHAHALPDINIDGALLQYRNMPSRKDGLSPSQKLYGHLIQDTLPAHHRAFAPEWQCSITEAEDRGRSHLEQVELYYNRHARALPNINVDGENIHNVFLMSQCKTIPLRGGTSMLWLRR